MWRLLPGGHPVAMKAERHPLGKVNGSDRLAAEVLGVEDHDDFMKFNEIRYDTVTQ